MIDLWTRPVRSGLERPIEQPLLSGFLIEIPFLKTMNTSRSMWYEFNEPSLMVNARRDHDSTPRHACLACEAVSACELVCRHREVFNQTLSSRGVFRSILTLYSRL